MLALPGQLYTIDQQCMVFHGDCWKNELRDTQTLQVRDQCERLLLLLIDIRMFARWYGADQAKVLYAPHIRHSKERIVARERYIVALNFI
jgi:hypothetical protein